MSIRRATIYFDHDLHRALSRKAEAANRSISNVVNDAVRLMLEEDAEDLKAFHSRTQEANLDLDSVARSPRRSRGS